MKLPTGAELGNMWKPFGSFQSSFNAVELVVGVHLLVGWVALEVVQWEALQVVAQEVVQMEDRPSILLEAICLAPMGAQPVLYSLG